MQGFFEEAEFFAAAEGFLGVEGIAFHVAIDGEDAARSAADRGDQAGAAEGAAVEAVGGAEETQQHAEGLGFFAGQESFAGGRIFGDASLVETGQAGEAAAFGIGKRQRAILKDHAGAALGMFLFAAGPADIMEQGGEQEEPAIGGAQAMPAVGEIEEHSGNTGDAKFMGDTSQSPADPVADRGFLLFRTVGWQLHHVWLHAGNTAAMCIAALQAAGDPPGPGRFNRLFFGNSDKSLKGHALRLR